MVTLAEFRLPRRILSEITSAFIVLFTENLEKRDATLVGAFKSTCDELGALQLLDAYNAMSWSEGGRFIEAIFQKLVDSGVYTSDDMYQFL